MQTWIESCLFTPHFQIISKFILIFGKFWLPKDEKSMIALQISQSSQDYHYIFNNTPEFAKSENYAIVH